MTFRDPSAWMWEDALELLDRAERLQRQFFRLQRGRQQCPNWEPPVDIFETEDELLILVALPGVLPEQVELVVDGAAIVIRGMRPIPENCKKALISRLEIPHGYFERRIELAPGRFTLLTQTLKDGCLSLTLAKSTRSSQA